MQYCKKCGAELLEEAEFCHSCGTPVAKPTAKYENTRNRTSVPSQAAKIAAIAIVSIIAVILIIGFLPTLLNTGRQMGQTFNPPNVAITSKNIRTGTVGLDYTAWVDVSIHNSGGPGTIVVWAEVTQGSNSWKKSMSLYLESQGSKDLSFTFAEVDFWTTQTMNYKVWVE